METSSDFGVGVFAIKTWWWLCQTSFASSLQWCCSFDRLSSLHWCCSFDGLSAHLVTLVQWPFGANFKLWQNDICHAFFANNARVHKKQFKSREQETQPVLTVLKWVINWSLWSFVGWSATLAWSLLLLSGWLRFKHKTTNSSLKDGQSSDNSNQWTLMRWSNGNLSNVALPPIMSSSLGFHLCHSWTFNNCLENVWWRQTSLPLDFFSRRNGTSMSQQLNESKPNMWGTQTLQLSLVHSSAQGTQNHEESWGWRNNCHDAACAEI